MLHRSFIFAMRFARVIKESSSGLSLPMPAFNCCKSACIAWNSEASFTKIDTVGSAKAMPARHAKATTKKRDFIPSPTPLHHLQTNIITPKHFFSRRFCVIALNHIPGLRLFAKNHIPVSSLVANHISARIHASGFHRHFGIFTAFYYIWAHEKQAFRDECR